MDTNKIQEAIEKCFRCVHMIKNEGYRNCDMKVDMLKAENNYACAYYMQKQPED